MQSLQMKPKLNWLFKLVCSKYMKDTCTGKSEIKNVCVQNEYFTSYFILIISILVSKFNQKYFRLNDSDIRDKHTGNLRIKPDIFGYKIVIVTNTPKNQYSKNIKKMDTSLL